MRNIPQTPRRRGGIPWRRTMAPSSALMVCFPAAFVFMLAGIGGAVSGQTGPSAPQQSVGAQLHRQPTPGSVQSAEGVSTRDADDALASAKQADAAGKGADCNAALEKARDLYGIR